MGIGFEFGGVSRLPNKVKWRVLCSFPLNLNGLTKESAALHSDLSGGPIKKKKKKIESAKNNNI
jgi:hypothetical protein